MKDSTLKIIIWTTSLLFIIITPALYFIKFNQNGVSTDPSSWAEFGDYFGGILNPIISVINLIILAYLSIRLVKQDDDRNAFTLQELSRPYGDVNFQHHDEMLLVEIVNCGLGPMIITSIEIYNSSGVYFKTCEELLDTIKTNCNYSIFTLNLITHLVIGANNSTILFKLNGNKADNEFIKYVKSSLELLKDCSIRLKYQDMYDRPMKTIDVKMFVA